MVVNSSEMLRHSVAGKQVYFQVKLMLDSMGLIIRILDLDTVATDVADGDLVGMRMVRVYIHHRKH
jgi:hypothetical protein